MGLMTTPVTIAIATTMATHTTTVITTMATHTTTVITTMATLIVIRMHAAAVTTTATATTLREAHAQADVVETAAWHQQFHLPNVHLKQSSPSLPLCCKRHPGLRRCFVFFRYVNEST